jgi:hypothetical protein
MPKWGTKPADPESDRRRKAEQDRLTAQQRDAQLVQERERQRIGEAAKSARLRELRLSAEAEAKRHAQATACQPGSKTHRP